MATELTYGTGVDAPHPDYLEMSPTWQMITTLLEGTSAMRAAGQVYLPKYEAELSDNYKKRLARSTLLPAFADTLDYLVGKVFQRPITLDPDSTSERIIGLADNIDPDRNSLNVFANWTMKDMMANGITHILVDMPPALRNPDGTPVIKTKADELAVGERLPYWVHVKAQQVIGWRSEVVDGSKVATQIRILEQIEKPVGDFAIEKVDQIRVLEIGSYRIFQEEGGAWVEKPELGGKMLDSDGQPLTYIPLVTIYAAEPTKFMVSDPPLEDLAYKNIEHYQVHSDYLNCLIMACFPILVVSGYKSDQDNKISIGPTTLMELSNENAKAYFAEHSGKALGSARTHLEDLKQEMAASGLQLLMPKTGATPTATGEAIDAAKSTSELQSMAQRLKDGLEKALDITADWLGDDHGSTVQINTDLTLTLGKMDIDQLIKAGSAPAYLLPKKVVWKEMIRRGFLAEQDLQELADMLEEEMGEMVDMKALAGALGRAKAPTGSHGTSPNLPGPGEPGTGAAPIGA